MYKKIFICCLILISSITSIAIAQVVRIPDANFKKRLILNGVDTNGDNQIQVSEAQKVTKLYVDNANILSLEGIKSFTNLEEFGFFANKIQTLDLQGMKKLKSIYGFQNNIGEVKLKGCVNLDRIRMSFNKITNIDLSDLKKLNFFDMEYNPLTQLTFHNLPELEYINAPRNALRDFKISGCPNVESISLVENQLSGHLDFTTCINLQALLLSDNPLTSLDIRGLSKLNSFNCLHCDLKTLNMSGVVSLPAGFHW